MMPVTIEEVKQEQSIFTDLWNIYKKYKNVSDDTEWDKYILETDLLFNNKYKGSSHEEMFRDMLLDITKQLERNQKEMRKKHGEI